MQSHSMTDSASLMLLADTIANLQKNHKTREEIDNLLIDNSKLKESDDLYKTVINTEITEIKPAMPKVLINDQTVLHDLIVIDNIPTNMFADTDNTKRYNDVKYNIDGSNNKYFVTFKILETPVIISDIPIISDISTTTSDIPIISDIPTTSDTSIENSMLSATEIINIPVLQLLTRNDTIYYLSITKLYNKIEHVLNIYNNLYNYSYTNYVWTVINSITGTIHTIKVYRYFDNTNDEFVLRIEKINNMDVKDRFSIMIIKMINADFLSSKYIN
jgi:hypothetical protein